MREHPRLRFGIGAIRIKGITLQYRNARFRGNGLFSNVQENRGSGCSLILIPRIEPICVAGSLLSPALSRSAFWLYPEHR
jgi:hypothetical protein